MQQTEASSWRPVQFLGNKLRVLDEVSKVVIRDREPGATVWDAFCGSTVVSQRLASQGMRVLATDKLVCSVTFARAMLSIGRGERADDLDALRAIGSLRMPADYELWAPYVEAEEVALTRGSAEDAIAVSRAVPLRWREASMSPAFRSVFDEVDRASMDGVHRPFASMTSTYAGTYFGVKQAIELDRLVGEVMRLFAHGKIQRWQADAGLTAVASAASAAVFSAGKHFAQPINANQQLTPFQARRLLQDRKIDVSELFLDALNQIEQSAERSGTHNAFELEAEHLSSDLLIEHDVSTVYADPPYTAQQYSRFYHVLDTLTLGVPANLQRKNGQITKGLYPVERFKSAFCSRRAAPIAFRNLAENAYDASARLVISYSESAPGSTGNSRSISLEELLQTVSGVYGACNVDVTTLDIRYRQFNQSSAAYASREDPEVLVVAEHR
ncbi:hypothetical protein [Paramicrobacterium humi]|nr:hypothetical protein [Microbacterium humi]